MHLFLIFITLPLLLACVRGASKEAYNFNVLSSQPKKKSLATHCMYCYSVIELRTVFGKAGPPLADKCRQAGPLLGRTTFAVTGVVRFTGPGLCNTFLTSKNVAKQMSTCD